MITVTLEKVSLADIQTLITNKVPEGKVLEYKEVLRIDSDREKGELLADITSFANTSGGHIIFGIKESNGTPIELTGLEFPDPDSVRLKIESILRDGIAPRLNIEIKFLEKSEGTFIVIFHVKRSWNKPHRVIYNAYSKTKDQFYSRNTAGKYQMDVIELKSSFNAFDLDANIKEFIGTRIFEIEGQNTPVPLVVGGKIALHLIPLENFANKEILDLTWFINQPQKLRPLFSMGHNYRNNLEGFLTYSGRQGETANSYAQIYRNGTIESVDAILLMDERSSTRDDGKKYLPSTAFEAEIVKALEGYLVTLKEFGMPLPIFVSLSLIGVRGYELGIPDAHKYFDKYYPIDRDNIIFPSHILESYDENPIKILRPMFDLLWNACGYRKSANFNASGQWIGQY